MMTNCVHVLGSSWRRLEPFSSLSKSQPSVFWLPKQLGEPRSRVGVGGGRARTRSPLLMATVSREALSGL